ncbi:MAG: DUF1611 domain-containing protein, partial [Candidatus Latescibacteria bacterium]|nr:DUF1611 domain-containing protein [Candidatus Latescibacterota bacterium]
GTFSSKTAASLIRYKPNEVVAVLDSTHAGERVEEIIEVGQGIPIVGTLQDALPYQPTALVIGIAPPGGVLPVEWRTVIIQAIRNGLEIVNGLHTFLTDDQELVGLAEAHGAKLWDVRRPPDDLDIGRNRVQELQVVRVLTVGADSSIGKMVAAIEIAKAAQAVGWDAEFVATGQTGIMIAGSGIAIDTVVSDFISGAVERLVMERRNRELLIIEGQGTIIHPSYSGVALGLLHGAAPQALVLCHQPGRDFLRRHTIRIPPLAEIIHLHEMIARPIFPTEVIAIALNCAGMPVAEARRTVDAVHRETGLPTTDCVKFGCESIVAALEPFRRKR